MKRNDKKLTIWESFKAIVIDQPSLGGQNIGEALRIGSSRYEFPKIPPKKYIKLA